MLPGTTPSASVKERNVFLNVSRTRVVGIDKSETMKTFLTALIALTGIVSIPTESQARDCGYRERNYHSYYREYPSYRYSHYRGDCEPRAYYGRSYYSSEPRRYYYSEPRHYRSERCYTERRHSFRPPLISFLFGF